MARTKPKLPMAVRHDINTSGIVEEEGSSFGAVDAISSFSTVLSSSEDRSPSPEEVHRDDLNWTRSNNPVDLDAPTITMTLANQAHVNGLVPFYLTLKIRHCSYPERTGEIIPWIRRYDPTGNPDNPFCDFQCTVSQTCDPVLHRFPVGRMDKRRG